MSTILPASGKITANCTCCGHGGDPINCDRCCVCTDGDIFNPTKWHHEYFWLEIAGIRTNPYFEGDGCIDCEQLNGKFKLNLRRFEDFPDCPLLKTDNEFGLGWCIYTTDEPAPTQSHIENCEGNEGDCTADTPNWDQCSPEGVPLFVLVCPPQGDLVIYNPWGACGAGAGVSYKGGSFCEETQGSNATCDADPPEEPCTLNRNAMWTAGGFYSECLIGPNIEDDDGENPIGFPPVDGTWSAKLTPGGKVTGCDESEAESMMVSFMAMPSMDEGEPQPARIRAPKAKERPPCHRRGEATGELVQCQTCIGRVSLKLFACEIHGSCTVRKPVEGHACCQTCHDYEADE